MKTKYKYIHFVEAAMYASPETVWLCKNNKSGATLAQLYYYPQWRQYVASYNKNAVFNESCQRDIADFTRQLKAESCKLTHKKK